ncbi:MAG: hypothetical protein DYG89_38340 [Caldilinea sp. CFX5]|nr:hypothetical protein [Caldilinea sp. CFX5]
MKQLTNQQLQVAIADSGSLLLVINHLAAEEYRFVADHFVVDTDHGRFSNVETPPVGITHTLDSLTYHFAFAQVTLDLVYQLDPANGFFRRSLKLTNQTPPCIAASCAQMPGTVKSMVRATSIGVGFACRWRQ